jgi:homoserine O-acetyltransferase/O-succinyltransferase
MNLAPRSSLSEPALAASARRGDLPLIFDLRHGGTAEASVRYELMGQGPLLVVAGGISAGRHALASEAFPEDGWWQAQAIALDSASHRILAIDWLGADGGLDCPIDPSDQADAIAAVLDALGVDSAAAFIGASYGGMVGMHFAARNPNRLGGLLAISASDYAHPFASASRALQRQAIELGEKCGDAAAGVALARAMAMLTYRTPEEFAERFARPPQISDGQVRVAAQDYLDAHGARHCQRMSGSAYRRLSESIDLHRIDPDDINFPLTLVAVDQDALVPSADIERFAARIPKAAFRLIPSRYGHDAFLKEQAEVGAIITDFLNSLESAQ